MSADIRGIEGVLRVLQPKPISYRELELAKRFLDPTRHGLPANASEKELVAAKVNEIMAPKWIQLILKICKFALAIITGTICLSSNSGILGSMPFLLCF